MAYGLRIRKGRRTNIPPETRSTFPGTRNSGTGRLIPNSGFKLGSNASIERYFTSKAPSDSPKFFAGAVVRPADSLTDPSDLLTWIRWTDMARVATHLNRSWFFYKEEVYSRDRIDGFILNLQTQIGGGGISVDHNNMNSNVSPADNGTYDLGTDTKYWGELYTNDINLSSNINIAPSGGNPSVLDINASQLNVTSDLSVQGNIDNSGSNFKIIGDGSQMTNVVAVNSNLLGGYSSSWYTAYTDTAISGLIDSAPGALDTLNELAAALGDDANFAGTLTSSIASKVSLTGDETIAGEKTFSDKIIASNENIFGTYGSSGYGINLYDQMQVTNTFHLQNADQPGIWSMLSWNATAGRQGNFDILNVNGGLLGNGGYGFAQIGAVKIGGNSNIDSIKDLVDLTMSGDLVSGTLAGDGTLVTDVDAATLGGYSSSWYTAYTDTAISSLIAAAPGALDTLNELAAALGDDANFAATITSSIATEASTRGTADTTLQSNIDAEATNILDEASARATADAAITNALGTAVTNLQTNIDTKVPLSGNATIFGTKTFQNSIQGSLTGNTYGIHSGFQQGDMAGNVDTSLITFAGNNTTLTRNPTTPIRLLEDAEYHYLKYTGANPIYDVGIWGMVTWTNNEDECMCGAGGEYTNGSCAEGSATGDDWHANDINNNQGFYQPACWTKRVNADIRALLFYHNFDDGTWDSRKDWFQDNLNQVGLLVKIMQETDPLIWKIFRVIDTPNPMGTCSDALYLDQATCEGAGDTWTDGPDAIPFFVEEFQSSAFCQTCGPQESWDDGNSSDVIIGFEGFGGPKNNKIEGALTGDLIPTADDLFDIGSAQFKIRDLYVSENSLWLGDEHALTIDNNSKMRTKRRDITTVPTTIVALAGDEAGALAYSGESALANMKLFQWLAYANSLAGGENYKIPDIYPPAGHTNYDPADWEVDVNLQTISTMGGTMTSHIIPDTDDVYDIGSAQFKIRDIYESEPSDINLKEDIVPFENALDFFAGMRVVNFTWKDGTHRGGRRETGLIAQDVKKAMDTHDYNDNFLWSEQNGEQGLDKKRLIPALVAAVKELTTKVKELEEELKK